MRSIYCVLFLLMSCVPLPFALGAPGGYYRQPAIHGQNLVFVAEGDLWKVGLEGGVATRLTSHPGNESEPAISRDGRTLAFVARYEGPSELYTMPLDGGLPTRRTYGWDGISVSGWTDDGRVIVGTENYSTLPNWQLVLMEVERDDLSGVPERVPLAQAADGWFADDGTMFFTRLRFQGSRTKRYKGGTAQNIWRFAEGTEAVPLTASYSGTSKRPMVWKGRIYFASDRDGTMNLWSMDRDGKDLRQHTRHSGWDVASPDLDGGRIAYQVGADLHVYDIAADTDRRVAIVLDSDLDQTRERWVDKPMDYLTSTHIAPDGKAVVLTARGNVFVAPRKQGRFVRVTNEGGVRHRDARFMPDSKHVLSLSDASGEVELWTLPANGVGDAEQLTSDGDKLRWQALPSPDGKLIAHHDKDQRLYLYDVEAKSQQKIDENPIADFGDLAWSPDSRWLAYTAAAGNMFSQIRLYSVEGGKITRVTSERFDSGDPAWSADGKWLYFLSDRNLVSIVGSPWGNYQPEPYLDKTTRIYEMALTPGQRSPFAPRDELHDDEEEKDEKEKKNGDEKGSGKKSRKKGKGESSDKDNDKPAVPEVRIELDGIEQRITAVPVPPGNYGDLQATKKALFWTERATGTFTRNLRAAKITRDEIEVETVAEEIRGYEISLDGKSLLLRKGDALHIVDAKPAKADLKESAVDLHAWSLSVIPREEWRQMFREAWRLERDYFYDRKMHGVDWPAMLERYMTLVDRVTTRAELSDLIGQMVGELSALHTFVGGGDTRPRGPDSVQLGSLGALLLRDEAAGGYRVEHVYRSDADEPQRTSPLARPGSKVAEGEVIESVNGVAALSVPDLGVPLRKQAGRQVLLGVRGADGEQRSVIVHPMTLRQADDLRYHEWEYTRRLEVERLSEGQIGYVHLRAMGGRNFTEWAKGYYPVFNRPGLIIDVRHNRGGNIDSWILSRLLRKAWFGWNQHTGQAPAWNMQYAFTGHVAVLCDERTASDGEAFSEGIKRLEIGPVIGTRTWGGEIWLTSSNVLVDRGIATAAEFGVYGPEGEWLVEGHGVEPDIVVDNLPHETFKGRDAQLEAAVEWLKKKMIEEPVPKWVPPPTPDKSFDYGDD